MKIIHERPPNFEDIRKVFPMADNYGVIFAFNGVIYSPSAVEIPYPLIKHEGVHLARQGTTEADAIKWWDKYLKDISFRYSEEVAAHRAEYQACIETASNRNMKRKALKFVAKRLASPLYGNMVTKKQAGVEILNSAPEKGK